MDQKALEKRTKLLLRRHGIRPRDVSGAYHGHVRETEILFHDVAHWVTLGHSLRGMPKNLNKRVMVAFEGLSRWSADSLEIDASLVTYLVGYTLRLWSSPGPIAQSCARNMKALMRSQEVFDEFEKRLKFQREYYLGLAWRIAIWFHPRLDPMSVPSLSMDKFPEDLSREQPS